MYDDDWFDCMCTCGGLNGCMVHPGPTSGELQTRIDDARAYCEATLRLTDGICLGVNDGDIREERRHMRRILRLLNGKDF